jgi:phosphoribosylaminoimidazole carboxylase PurE protein
MAEKKGGTPVVGIVMGSDSDLPVMKEAEKVLNQFHVPYEITLSSAHRSPDRTIRYAKSVEERGLEVIIVGAGAAAHLAGFIAWIPSLPPCKCQEESPWLPWPSARWGQKMPPYWPFRYWP